MKQFIFVVFILVNNFSFSQINTGKTLESKQLAKAEDDKEFDNGSTITREQLQKIPGNDLADVGKIWGFLKYHHPVIASGKYNWDYELFRFLLKYKEAESKQAKQVLLSAWVTGLGAFEERKYAEAQPTEIALPPDLNWIQSSGFHKELKARLMAIKNAARTGKHYYIGNTQDENPEFKNENPYESMNYPDAGFRLLALFRYWNTIQYYFPYRNLIDGNWNDVLMEFIPKFLAAPDEIHYKLTALKLIARINDTHADMQGDSVLNKYFGDRNAAIDVSFIENEAVVTGYHKKTLGEKSGLKKGDILQKINGKAVADIIRESLPITPASNYPTQLRKIATKLLRTNDSLIVVDYKRGQETGRLTIKSYDLQNMQVPRKNQRKDTCFRMIRPDISYLYPGSFKNRYLPKITPEILKTKGLIVDLRCYPSDDLVDTFSNTLLPSPQEFVKYSIAKLSEPGLFEFASPIEIGADNPDYFKGQVVILINELTQSASEYTAMAFRTAPKVKVIGSTTAGADGNTSPIYFPGNVMTYISAVGVFYPDGRGTQRVGIIPDIQISPTIKGIAEDRDELIEKAIEIIDGK
ncbi:S41 family peptidase [Dyadobacter pollutisoli]|uniref:S41 family peptidase n=1 Tax=Dyadobacter pollutisoli TaxID=2910158 RepID=A0A9E8SP10_9BACT|nr:S41 family peptidase [Dyadobacter pollutisoli]WAC14909.1 S41 family peptidase [Dyadobacter pollutisoli]